MSAPHVDTGLLGVQPVLTRGSQPQEPDASAVKCLLHIPLEVGQVSLEAVKSVIPELRPFPTPEVRQGSRTVVRIPGGN